MVKSYEERMNEKLDAYNKAYQESKAAEAEKDRSDTKDSRDKELDDIQKSIDEAIKLADEVLGTNSSKITSVITGETVKWDESTTLNFAYGTKAWEREVSRSDESDSRDRADSGESTTQQTTQVKEVMDRSLYEMNNLIDKKCVMLEEKMTVETTGLLDGLSKNIMDFLSLGWFIDMLIKAVLMIIDKYVPEVPE